MKIPQSQYFDTIIDFTVVLRHQVPPSQMLQRRQMSLATSIWFDKTYSFRVGDWCRPNRKSGHRWRGHRVYPRRSCKSNGSDDGTSEQALPRTVVRRFIPGSCLFLQFFVMSDAARKRRVKSRFWGDLEECSRRRRWYPRGNAHLRRVVGRQTSMSACRRRECVPNELTVSAKGLR